VSISAHLDLDAIISGLANDASRNGLKHSVGKTKVEAPAAAHEREATTAVTTLHLSTKTTSGTRVLTYKKARGDRGRPRFVDQNIAWRLTKSNDRKTSKRVSSLDRTRSRCVRGRDE